MDELGKYYEENIHRIGKTYIELFNDLTIEHKAFLIACMIEDDITEIVQNTKDYKKITDSFRNDALLCACRNNMNLNVIKYLVEDQKMNLSHENYWKNNALILACIGNKNIEVIKYLVEVHKMDLSDVNIYSDNALECASK